MKRELVETSLSVARIHRDCMPIVVALLRDRELFAKCGESILRGSLIVVHEDESISFVLGVLP